MRWSQTGTSTEKVKIICTSNKRTVPQYVTQLVMRKCDGTPDEDLIFHWKHDCKYDLFAGDKRLNKDLKQIRIFTVEHTTERN